MKRQHAVLLVLLALAVGVVGYGAAVIRRGFSAADQPSALESVVSRTVRNLGIPSNARDAKNPWTASPEILHQAREDFADHCAGCHGKDGNARSEIGQNLYPKAPDLRAAPTQKLTDGEIHYIIRNGVRLTGMPALGNPHVGMEDNTAWKLVLFIRAISQTTPEEKAEQSAMVTSAYYVGSAACQKCHAQIYEHWQKTPMANIVRDPRQHPNAIIPSLASNTVFKFTKEQVALVYGSIWKQRYFTKIGDDYFPLPVQWEVKNHKWSRYFVGKGADWWEPFYPPPTT
jgi:cytochrome c553